MLVERGRLTLDRDVLEWIHAAVDQARLEVVDLSPEIAVRSTRLGAQLPSDPADRLIVATAQELNAPLVTRDDRLQNFAGVEAIW